MPAWLNGRHGIPPQTRALLEAKATAAGTGPAPPPKPARQNIPAPSATPAPTGELGVAAALRRLEQAEFDCHAAWKTALTNPNSTLEEVECAATQWKKVGDSLRQYELAVEQDRRASGELIPRKELEDYARGFLINFCQSVQASLEGLAPKLTGLESPQAVGQILMPAYARALREAVRHTAERPFCGKTPPAYLIKAIESALHSHL